MKKLLVVIGVAVVLGGCTQRKEEVVGDGFDFPENTSGYAEYVKLSQGCGGKDCIPAINEPKFETRTEAGSWLKDEDLVLGLDYKGEHKAYPVRILNWHEVVNDGILVTFSPLCGSAVGFKTETKFGVSGKLKHGCPVLYDRETQSLWEQVTGEAIVGRRRGEKLEQVPVQVLRWQEWKTAHPATMVLSQKTGVDRDYGAGSYEREQEEVVYGVRVGGESRAYSLDEIKRDTADDGVLVDTVGGEKVRLSYRDGEIFVENLSTKARIIPTRMFKATWEGLD